jgi:hypothetical protein
MGDSREYVRLMRMKRLELPLCASFLRAFASTFEPSAVIRAVPTPFAAVNSCSSMAALTLAISLFRSSIC